MQKLASMKMQGMINAFQNVLETGQASHLAIDALLAHIVDSEWDYRKNRKRERLLKQADFRYHATFQEIDFQAARNLDQNLLLRLSDCSFISDKKDLIITGPTGCGKSFIGSALGHQVCEHGYKTAYFGTSKLLGYLKSEGENGNYLRTLNNLQKTDLLIIDDFGLNPFDAPTRLALLDILEDRHARKSTMFISQLPVSTWNDLIGESTVADAIMDRIAYNSFRIELTGESMRKKYQKND